MDERIPLGIRLLGVPGLNRLLMRTLGRPSPGGVRRVYDRFCVADAELLAGEFYEFKYASQIIEGAEMTQLTALESLVTLRGLKAEHDLRDELLDLNVPTLLSGARRTPTLHPGAESNSPRRCPTAVSRSWTGRATSSGSIGWIDVSSWYGISSEVRAGPSDPKIERSRWTRTRRTSRRGRYPPSRVGSSWLLSR